MRVLVTSGGTKVHIDRVRHIGNMSSGTFGSAIAKEFLLTDCHVDFLMAEGSKNPFELRLDMNRHTLSIDQLFELDTEFLEWKKFIVKYEYNYKRFQYKSFDTYKNLLETALIQKEYDIVVLAAAVSDYGVENYVDGKIRSNSALQINLKPLQKLILNVKRIQPKTFLVGFKLLVDSTKNELINAAKISIMTNNCNMVVANDLEDIQNDNHTLHIVKNRYGKPVSIDKATCEEYGITLAGFLVKEILKNIK